MRIARMLVEDLEREGGRDYLRGHPYEFDQKTGFVIVGVRPDIFTAKRVS